MTKNPSLLALICCFCLTMPAHAEIYSWTDESGNVIYSDQKTSNKAKISTPSANVNYYDAPSADQKTTSKSTVARPLLSTLTTADHHNTPATTEDGSIEAMSEEDCQQQYQRSCDAVIHWEKYAIEQCGTDSRCKDKDFLDRKYRPRTNAEMLVIARRAASRNNLLDKRINQYLNKKYTNHCENQAAMYCQKKRSRQCKAEMLLYCEDPRSLEDIFNRYDNLSINEKRAIIAKAKQLATANGENSLDYEQILVSIIDILISQALMGI